MWYYLIYNNSSGQETWNLELNFHIASYGLFWILIDANLPKCRILKWTKLFALWKQDLAGYSSYANRSMSGCTYLTIWSLNVSSSRALSFSVHLKYKAIEIVKKPTMLQVSFADVFENQHLMTNVSRKLLRYCTWDYVNFHFICQTFWKRGICELSVEYTRTRVSWQTRVHGLYQCGGSPARRCAGALSLYPEGEAATTGGGGSARR